MPTDLEEKSLFQDEILKNILTKVGSHDLSKPQINFTVGSSLAFYVVTKKAPHQWRFIQEMGTKHLFPGKKTTISRFCSFDFENSDEAYSAIAFEVPIKHTLDVQQKRHIDHFVQELLLGLPSRYYSDKILEMKGMSQGEKLLRVHEKINQYLERFPGLFDDDITDFVQTVCKEGFALKRDISTLVRSILSLYTLHVKALKRAECISSQHHIAFKVRRILTDTPFGEQTALGITVSVSFANSNERLNVNHLLDALPDYQVIPGSHLPFNEHDKQMVTFYVEVERKDGMRITLDDVKKEQMHLQCELDSRIERLIHPTFMQRNEEEVMRNMITLSSQLKYVKDLPQVHISYEEQSDQQVVFTVIIARIVSEETLPFVTMFPAGSDQLHVTMQRVKRLGQVRRRYPKEVAVFRMALSHLPYLRKDRSLDLYKARTALASTLFDVVGEFRDYNGGMMLKQKEVYEHLSKAHPEAPSALLEAFFHGIYPVERRTTLPPPHLTALFCLTKRCLDERLPSVKEMRDGMMFEMSSYQTSQEVLDVARSLEKELPRHCSLLQLSYQGHHLIGLIYA